jgi:xylose isomerase
LGLEKDFKCNIEANHATLAGHTFSHDLQVCADNGMLGSVDANQGDSINGWIPMSSRPRVRDHPGDAGDLRNGGLAMAV